MEMITSFSTTSVLSVRLDQLSALALRTEVVVNLKIFAEKCSGFKEAINVLEGIRLAYSQLHWSLKMPLLPFQC